MLLNDSGCSLFIHFVMKVSPFGKCALPPFSFLPYPFFALDALRDVLNRIAHRKHLILPWRVTKPCCESSARCVNEASLQAALRWKETPLCHQGLAQAVTHPCPVFFLRPGNDNVRKPPAHMRIREKPPILHDASSNWWKHQSWSICKGLYWRIYQILPHPSQIHGFIDIVSNILPL